jgi:hypothetical protein
MPLLYPHSRLQQHEIVSSVVTRRLLIRSACTHMYTHTHTHTHTHTRTHTHTHTRTHARTHAHTHTHKHVNKHASYHSSRDKYTTHSITVHNRARARARTHPPTTPTRQAHCPAIRMQCRYHKVLSHAFKRAHAYHELRRISQISCIFGGKLQFHSGYISARHLAELRSNKNTFEQRMKKHACS